MTWDFLHKQYTSRWDTITVRSAITPLVATAHPDETLRHVADQMAALHQNALPVTTTTTTNHHTIQGIITVEHLLAARRRQLTEERHRERPLRLRPQRRPTPIQERT